MIKHELLAGKTLRKFHRNRQMLGINQNVICQTEFLKQANSAKELRLQEEAIGRES